MSTYEIFRPDQNYLSVSFGLEAAVFVDGAWGGHRSRRCYYGDGSWRERTEIGPVTD